MSEAYDKYLEEHIGNVQTGYDWIKTNVPHLVPFSGYITEIDRCIKFHDSSKTHCSEYEAYDRYFYKVYGGNHAAEVLNDFQYAWLTHIHSNPHHWQHWILHKDDPEGCGPNQICLEMPYKYIVEMICDWWAFSWKKGDLYEIFNWFTEREYYIKLHSNTRIIVNYILKELRKALDASEHGNKKEKNDGGKLVESPG